MNIFGVEAAADGARVAVIETSLRSARVSRLAYVPGGGEDAARVAARALASLGYDPQSDHVALALSGAALTSRAFSVPLTRPEQIQEALPYELASRLPFGAEEIVCGYTAIAASGGESTILAVAARKDETAALIRRFAEAGVDPDLLAPAPLCAAAGGGATQGARAALTLADGAVTVTVITSQGAPIGFHTAPLAPDAGSAKIAAEARRAVMAACAARPGLEVDYYEVGGVAQGSALRAALTDALGAPVRPLALPGADAPAAGPGVGGAESRPLFAVALGAARIAAGLEPGLRLNLRYGDLRKRRALAAKGSRAMAAAALFGVGLVVWAAGWMMEGAALAARHAQLRAEARALFTAAMPGVTAVSGSQQLKAALQLAQAKARALGVSENGVDPFLDMLLDVSRAKPAGAAVDIGDLAYDASRLSLSGRTDSFEKVEQYRAAIDALPWAEKVTMDQAKSGAASGAVEFRLNVEIKP